MITKERLMMGYTYKDYLKAIQKNLDKFEKAYEEVSIAPDDKKALEQFGKKVYVLGIGEDWCPDVYTNLPVMARVAELNPNIEFRVFMRDKNHDLMNHYLFRGQSASIPAFGFFDEHFKEFGRWLGGRPKYCWDLIDAEGREKAMPKVREFYATSKGQETAREFREILYSIVTD
ncbi:MAG: thioredoxin family protein [Candidatus Tectomicrobia bacterium]|nr:thioredoxin family protein [Candidatus Tectomicrobia bacterium]